jgi:hypothetical protein
MFKYSLRHTFTALFVWAGVLLVFLAAGARSSPRDPPPVELAGDLYTALRTAVRYPTPLPPTQTPTPTTLPTKAPPYGVQIYPSLLYTSRAQLEGFAPARPTATRFPISIAPTRVGGPTPMPTIDPGPYEVQIFPSILYTSKAELDIFAPAEPGDWPVVVVFHGKLGTTREAMHELAQSTASFGAVVFVPTWRTMASPNLVQSAEDAACAIRFARKYAVEYSGVPDRIIGAGHSGGAWVAALMGLVGDEFTGDCLVEGGSGYLDGVVALEGPYDIVSFSQTIWNAPHDKAPLEFWEKMSPLFYVDKIPPREGMEYHLFISDTDWPPREDSYVFYIALLDAGYKAQLTFLNNIRPWDYRPPLPETVQAILDMARGEAPLP